jgi:hypothetical protein
MQCAQNGNLVNYKLHGLYRTLNIEVAVPGGGNSTAGSIFELGINGQAYLLDNPSSDADFFPLVTEPTSWTIDVSGAQTLQLVVKPASGTDGTPLLVSGSLAG